IILTDLVDDIFYAQVHLVQADRSILKLDSRFSDAVALALVCDRPMYILDSLLAGIGISTSKAYAIANQPKTLKDFSIDQLQKMLEESVHNEAFNRAAKIRDELNRRSTE
ncbi:MAG: bifunctional nuclease domain-containing protein, partial [Bacteroidota bacterium]